MTVPSTGPSLRILALGNDILGDDAFAFLVAQRVRERIPGVEVRCSSASGFHLLDDLLGVERLLVVDTVMTGNAPPGTVYVVREGDLEVTPGNSPHYTGIFETLSLARALHLNAPREVAYHRRGGGRLPYRRRPHAPCGGGRGPGHRRDG